MYRISVLLILLILKDAVSLHQQHGATTRRNVLSFGGAWILSSPKIASAVVANPFEKIDAQAVLGDEEAVNNKIGLEEAVALLREKKVKSVKFLTAGGDVSVAQLSDGTSVYIEIDNSPVGDRGPYTWIARLRDAKIPYQFPFNLSGYATVSKRDINAPALKIQSDLQRQEAESQK